MRRVAIYRRISTDEAHQPFSLEAQETKLGAYSTSQDDWQLTATYVDQASGATLERPALQRALAHARAGRFDVLLVYRVDRLSRSIRQLALVLDELDHAGVVFRSATEPFDTATAAGRMLVQMLGVFAEFERATIIDRVVNGMERKAARGEWNGGFRPFGYRVDPATAHLVVIEDEAPIVRVIFDLYLRKHKGARAISGLLNKRGHRTQTGKEWSHNVVLTVLRNRIYLGEVHWRDTWHTSPDPARPFHPPLIDPEAFNAAQTLLTERGEAPAHQVITGSDYLLSGLIHCQHCGKAYIGAAAHGRSKRYRYYVCFSRQRYGKATCAADRIPADQAEDGILEALLTTYEDSDLVIRSAEAAAVRANEQQDQQRDELSIVEASIKETEEQIERYLRAFEAKTLPEQMCGARVRDLGVKLTDLQARRSELLQDLDVHVPAPTEEDLAKLRHQIREALTDGDERPKKALVQALTHEIKVTGRHLIKPIFVVPEPNETRAEPLVRPLSDSVRRQGLEPRTR